MPGEQTEQKFQSGNAKKILVFVKYKPAGVASADAMLGGAASKVQGVVDKVESAANSIPGLSLFFKEEKEPEKQCDKEYNYFNDYKDWDKYIQKMTDDFPEKTNTENQVISFDFDASDISGREKEGKKLANQIKSKVSEWKDYTANFHFVGIGQGGNVANECIKELINEADFKKKWKVSSVVYIGTPLYANHHIYDKKKAGNPVEHSFINNYDLTQKAISYLEPNDKLLKLVAECNSNTLSIFTGKIKSQLVTTLGRLLSIESFGTSSDNKGNLDKIKQVKDDASNLLSELIDAVKSILNALPGLWDFDDFPDLKKLKDGLDSSLVSKGLKRFDDGVEQLKKISEGSGINRSLNTSNANLGVLLNFLCPIVEQLTAMLALLKPGTQASTQLFDKLIDKSGVEKILAPGTVGGKSLPVDPYVEKVVEMAKKAKENEGAGNNKENGQQPITQEQLLYDQSTTMINKCAGNIKAVAPKSDLDLKGQLTEEQKAKAGEIFSAILLPMMPSKKKFFGIAIQYIPESFMDFLEKISGDSAMAPIKSLMAKVPVTFSLDESNDPAKPGLGYCIQELFKEVGRIKGYLSKNSFPVHKDANSLYFIYNSHNILLKKPWGDVMNTIDKEIGYLDAMKAQGYDNFFNLEKNEYQGGGAQKENVQPAKAVKEEPQNA